MQQIMELLSGPGDGDEPLLRGIAILAGLGRAPGDDASRIRVKNYIIPNGPDSRLGEGSFGEVYKARDLRLNRTVALKIVRFDPESDAIQKARMDNEAQAMAFLQGTVAVESVVQIYDTTRTTDGRPCLVLEYVEGGGLDKKIEETGPMPADEAATLVRTIAEIVEKLHEKGMLHRDLKPSNILLTTEGKPKLADFGLARFPESRGNLTLPGQPLGTPAYMSPEQAQGRYDEVHETSDVYSLGAILYECLTGQAPFVGRTLMVLLQVIEKEPLAPRRPNDPVPVDLETICLKALAKEPAHRYPSAAALADDLTRYLERRPIKARRAGLWEHLVKWVRRNKVVSSLIALVAVSIAVGFIASLLYAGRAERQKIRAERQKVRAEQNAASRFRALDDVLKTVSDNRLRLAGQNALQKQLIEGLLPRFEEVIQIEGDDDATRNLQGMAWNSLTVIRQALGRRDGALESSERAEAVFRDLRTRNPELLVEASMGLGTALSHQGTMLGQGGKFDDAIAKLVEAANLFEGLARAGIGGVILFERLGHAHNSWANGIMYKAGDAADAETIRAIEGHYRESVRWFEAGAAASPICRDWQARTLSNLALFLAKTRPGPDDAIAVAIQAADLARGLVLDFPADLDSRECLATCLTNVAEIRKDHGDPAGSAPMFRETLALYERLLLQVPDSFEFRWCVAMATSNLAHAQALGPAKGWPSAAESFRRADVLYQDLIKLNPGNTDLARYSAENIARRNALEARRLLKP
jgi:tRNA A-37 threonylcarbamoyl transferase component Bud32/tetratricopeptide (TPR) repeat protein